MREVTNTPPTPKETGLLLSGDMVRAFLANLKGQTRRTRGLDLINKGPNRWRFDRIEDGFAHFIDPSQPGTPGVWCKCPFGGPGDLLWFKETWRVGMWLEEDGQILVDYRADGHCSDVWVDIPDEERFNHIWEQSCSDAAKVYGVQERYSWKPGQSPCRWRPSTFMPKAACRCWARQTAKPTPQRVRDISEEDAIAEGIERTYPDAVCPWRVPGKDMGCRDPIAAYGQLWDTVNGPGAWARNDWVWRLTFERIDHA